MLRLAYDVVSFFLFFSCNQGKTCRDKNVNIELPHSMSNDRYEILAATVHFKNADVYQNRVTVTFKLIFKIMFILFILWKFFVISIRISALCHS